MLWKYRKEKGSKSKTCNLTSIEGYELPTTLWTWAGLTVMGMCWLYLLFLANVMWIADIPSTFVKVSRKQISNIPQGVQCSLKNSCAPSWKLFELNGDLQNSLESSNYEHSLYWEVNDSTLSESSSWTHIPPPPCSGPYLRPHRNTCCSLWSNEKLQACHSNGHVAAKRNLLELCNWDRSSAGGLLFPSLPLPFHEWPGCNLRQIVALCLLTAWDEVSWGMAAARFQIDGVLKPQSEICWQQSDPPWGIQHNMLSRFLGQLPTSRSYVSNNYPSWGRRRALALAADDCLNKCV